MRFKNIPNSREECSYDHAFYVECVGDKFREARKYSKADCRHRHH